MEPAVNPLRKSLPAPRKKPRVQLVPKRESASRPVPKIVAAKPLMLPVRMTVNRKGVIPPWVVLQGTFMYIIISRYFFPAGSQKSKSKRSRMICGSWGT
jgi:hypothetical protein